MSYQSDKMCAWWLPLLNIYSDCVHKQRMQIVSAKWKSYFFLTRLLPY